MALITLSTYKTLMGVDATNTTDDAQITGLLEAASLAVETFAGRDFDVTSGSATMRSYLYEGEGILDISDCTAITSVAVTVPGSTSRTLTSDEYTAMPYGAPVFYYLVLHGGVSPFGISPEMGFTWNLDTYPFGSYKQPTIEVTATWGWPAVPEDVKLATALTIHNLVSRQGAEEGLTSESIEGWSRSWGGRNTPMASLVIPNRARDLLVNYQRTFA